MLLSANSRWACLSLCEEKVKSAGELARLAVLWSAKMVPKISSKLSQMKISLWKTHLCKTTTITISGQMKNKNLMLTLWLNTKWFGKPRRCLKQFNVMESLGENLIVRKVKLWFLRLRTEIIMKSLSHWKFTKISRLCKKMAKLQWHLTSFFAEKETSKLLSWKG